LLRHKSGHRQRPARIRGIQNHGEPVERIGPGQRAALNLRGIEVGDVARGDGNLLHPIRAALATDASLGEVCGAMRDVFGEYKGGAFF